MHTKYAISYICFLLVCNISLSQEKNIFDYWLNEYTLGYELYEKEDFTNAIPHFTNALSVIDQIDFSTNNETRYYPINNQNYLGVCYFRLEQYENAATHFEGAIKQLDLLKTKDDTFYNQILDNLLNSYTNFDLQKSLEVRLKIIERLNDNPGIEDLNYAQHLFSLAFNYKHLNNKDEFYNTLIEVESILTDLGEINNDFYAFTLFYLGDYYVYKGDFETADIYFKKAEGLEQYLSEISNLEKFTRRFKKGIVLYEIQDYNLAITQLERVLKDIKELYPSDSESFLVITEYLGIAYFALNLKEKYIELYKNSLKHIEDILGSDTLLYAQMSINFTKQLIERDDFNEVEPALEKAKQILVANNKVNTIDYALLLNYFGVYNFNKGNYNLAETNYLESLRLQKLLRNPTTLEIGIVQGNLASLYQVLGDYDKAETYFMKSFTITQELKGEMRLTYIKGLMSYANLFIQSSNYEKAELKLNEAVVELKNIVGKNNQLYAEILLNFGELYVATRQLKESLQNYNEAEKLFLDLNNNEPSYGLALAKIGKGLIYDQLGDSKNAIALQLEALRILEITTGKKQIDYGKLAQNLGLSFQRSGNTEKAKYYYDIAIENYKATIGTNHFIYALLQTNVSQVLVDNNKLAEAESLLKTALLTLEKSLGKENIYYASSLKMLAMINLRQGKLNEAQNTIVKLEPILKKSAGETSDTYIDLLFIKALTNDLQENYSDAISNYEAYNNGIFNLIDTVFTYRSESDKKSYIIKLKNWLAWYSSLLLRKEFNSSITLESNLNNQLILKSLLLNSSKDMLTQLASLNDKNIDTKISEFKILKNQKSSVLNGNNTFSKTSIEAINAKINTLETSLVEIYTARFNINNLQFDKDWKNVQKALQTSDIAIEFTQFNNRSAIEKTQDIVYAAFIIHKDWTEPKFMTLCNEAELKAILKNQNPNTLYQTRGSKAKSATNTKGLYELIWSPIEKYLEGIQTIYFSPSGLLNQIPFAALNTEDKPILADQFNMVQLSSTYKITEAKTEPKADNTLFIGGINYDYTPSESKVISKNDVSQLSNLKSVPGTRSLGTQWNYLPGTLKEVNTIESIFTEKNKTYSSLTADTATETSFKNLSGKSPNIIHTATHGFFFENPKRETHDAFNSSQQNIYTVAEDPLLRSGLLFSGANYAWQNGSNPHKEDDGILTALEIANLDLSNTDLVVLSACETGLGDIDGSEGVYGLQRAFKMAGVDIIVMSLWEVPDIETSEFMTLFYTNWLNGMKVRKAFQETQKTMSETYKDNPEKWAAFVLFE